MRIAIIGLSHDHVWGHLPDLQAHPEVELVAAADGDPALRERVNTETGCATYASDDELLAAETVDAAYVFADNRGGAAAATRALEAGLHVLIEKPMAADIDGAEAMHRAATAADRRLMINWPIAWWPSVQQALRLVADGLLGELWQVRYRAAHSGPRNVGCSAAFCDWLYDPERNGAGAYMDYCCYGSILARVALGTPEAVTGITAQVDPSLPVEDNGVLMLHYPRALAVAEASWSQVGKLTAYTTVFYGSTGTLLLDHQATHPLVHATKADPGGVPLGVPEPAPELRGATAHFVHGVQTGAAFHDLVAPDPNLDAQRALVQGLASAREGRRLALESE